MKNLYEYLNGANVDISKYENIQLDEREKNDMKKLIRNHKKKIVLRIASTAACFGLIAAVSQTSFAKEIIGNIIKSISTGKNTYYQVEPPEDGTESGEKFIIDYEDNGEISAKYFSGRKYYDKDGNIIENMPENDGVEVEIAEITAEENAAYVIKMSGEKNPVEKLKKEGWLTAESEEELMKFEEALGFKPLLPGNVPEGFFFAGACMNDSGSLLLYYKNGEENYISISERAVNDDKIITVSTDEEIREVKLSGGTAVFSGGRSLDWEADGVAFGIDGRGHLSEEELINMAEAMK